MTPVSRRRQRTRDRYLAVWNGDAPLKDLERVVTPGFVGHMGSRSRDLAGLAADITAYRTANPGVRFTIEDAFEADDAIASRIIARATRTGAALVAVGLNISRWEGDRLAEEWAVWEALHPAN